MGKSLIRKWPLPRPASKKEVVSLFQKFHAYKGCGAVGQIWGCFEGEECVAAWTWQPPPFGAALAVSPSSPAGALALSRMVATPVQDRGWHLSKPLRWIMRRGLDRGRWPVLVTFADTGEGHRGHVYTCSGWERDGSSRSLKYLNSKGERRSVYVNGRIEKEGLLKSGASEIVRFVHRACSKGTEMQHMKSAGWVRVPSDRRWRSGNPAFKWVKG